ncbi:uncharacterized protein LOC126617074 [Malus sylvestris]|uniref:uncharacterized protein LOC126617074 n=1 Tax=Malus sylvestris TaxID=3752 RepID=UPI0004988FE3|nr:uncharacterized protein LOC126617074 [Malus sylvestris]
MCSPPIATSSTKQKPLPLGALCKAVAISGVTLLFFYIFLFDKSSVNYQLPSNLFKTLKESFPAATSPLRSSPPTNLRHIVFGIVGSMNTWKAKRPYIEVWWRSNVTRGYLFLDRAPTPEFLPWPSSSPPFRVNEYFTRLKGYPQVRKLVQVRIVRTILETFREGDKDVRWYVMADDDTVLLVDNLVEVLEKYDHEKYHYIGMNSECVKSNFDFSFNMAFGGAGYALSYPLMAAVATKLDGCIERYPYIWVSDFMLQSCLADLGVALTQEKGFHQIDLHGDISGLLSSHPEFPFLSLHHLDTINPIFPSMNRSESINHLMKSAKVDHSRLLQQTICYHRPSNWSFSISWGYSAHIYETIIPRSILRRPLETFRPWVHNARAPLYMFNTRWPSNNPCEAPHVFFFESIYQNNTIEGRQTVTTTYSRASQRGLPPCSSSGNHSADFISKIQVQSLPAKRLEVSFFDSLYCLSFSARGIDCCDIVYEPDINTAQVIYRACMDGEIIA